MEWSQASDSSPAFPWALLAKEVFVHKGDAATQATKDLLSTCIDPRLWSFLLLASPQASTKAGWIPGFPPSLSEQGKDSLIAQPWSLVTNPLTPV